MCAFEYYTYDDYVNWEGDWELIDGIAYAMAPSPVKDHQFLLSILAIVFGKEILKCNECKIFVEMDYKIDEENVVRPDLAILCKEDKEKRFISIAPELIIEVVSKSSAKRDEKIKFKMYEKEKVKYYVLAYPDDKKVKVFKLKDDKYTKIGDFREEACEFELNNCKINVDFKEVFERI